MNTGSQSDGLKRAFLLLGVSLTAMAISVGVLWFGSGGATEPSRITSPPPIQAMVAGENENEAYRQLLAQQNKTLYEQAKKQGTSMVAALSGTRPVIEEKQDEAPVASLPSPIPPPRLRLSSAPRRQLPQADAAMAKEIRSIMESWHAPQHEVTLVQAPPPSDHLPVPPSLSFTDTVPAGPLRIQAGTRLYAALETAVNSDYPGAVTALVLDGAFQGGRLIGTFKRSRDRIILEFTRLALPDGYTIDGLSAVAVDSHLQLPALKGKVDYHILHNYVLPAAARFTVGLGNAFGRGEHTVLHGPLGNSTVIGEDAELGTALGLAAAQIGAGVLDELSRGRRQPTVRIPATRDFSVLVLQDWSQKAATPAAAKGLAGTRPVQNIHHEP